MRSLAPSQHGPLIISPEVKLKMAHMKKTIPVSIGIFWESTCRESISLWMQKRNDPEESKFNGLLEFPGGKIEIGESVTEAVVREIKEEVGIDIASERRIKFFGYYKTEYEKTNIFIHVFLIYGDQKILRSGQWIQFNDNENASKIKKQTLPANEQIINDVLAWIQKARNENRPFMIWD